MTPRGLAIVLAVYAVALAAACSFVYRAASLRAPAQSVTVASWWSGGVLQRRSVRSDGLAGRAVVAAEEEEGAQPEGSEEGTLVLETIVGESAMVIAPELAFALSLVPGRDGVAATIGGETAYVTPDDLLARDAYDHGVALPELGIAIGARTDIVLALVAERLGVSVPEVRARARLRRIRVARAVPRQSPAPPSVARPEALTREAVREAALGAARYLARGISPDGHLRYTVDARTNAGVPGYEWARHAGATYFLAQAAALSKEPELEIAAVRAAALMRDKALLACGGRACVGAGDVVEIGASALAVIAFVELDRAGLDASFRPLIAELAAFLRAQQRPDGEMMHEYDRAARRPRDVQLLYYTGEAALALARAHRITGDRADLDAASRALARLVGPAWSFFGSRYYFGEEHWTCQALAELWDRAPSGDALDFCVRWHAYGRKLQFGPGETPFDADGAFGIAPFVTPRLTPVASRTEAAIATRRALAKSASARAPDPATARELAALDAQLRRSLALLVRQGFRPGPAHLFADPAAVAGAIPGSEVDWALRIDYAQHAGSAMIAWLEGEDP